FFLGHVSGNSLWDAETNKIKLNLNVFSRVDYILFVEGSYGLKDQSLDFLVELRNTEMSIIEPFAKEYISELGGQVSGKVRIKGNIQAPKVSGVLDFNQSRFKVNYLGTKFTFSDKVYISEDEIKIKRLRLLDSKNHVAIVRGSIYHQSFKNLYFRLFSEFDNFILIDTEKEDNDLYYGTAIVTGEASIIGDTEDIKISGDISNERGTKIFIPLDGYETTTQKDYIEFVDLHAIRQDTVVQTVQQLSLKGIRMDLNLDIDEDAYFEIIFDQKAGDIIRGRGEGKIQMAIDTKGEFSMYGDYYIKQGSYNFTLMNLVNKKFEIRDNSRILFVGGLFDAELQVFASYDQPTSLAPIVDPALSETGGADFTRRYPVSVLLELNGALLSPDIKLSLDFKEAERSIQNSILLTALIDYENTLANNEQELNRQAFSLILLKTLSTPNSFSGVNASSGRNLSELLSNQLSHWMSQVDENLQIDVDLLSSDVNSNNAYQVTLTYTFLEGRLRVTRDGLVDTQNQNAAANIVGEWTVEYLLTKDGRYRLKMYNRNTPDISADNINGNTTTTAGFSITQTQNFNTLRELFGLKPKEKKIRRNVKKKKHLKKRRKRS
ncbi:MAG: translocation/assembly module TamB domain-containing protein, partial [Bacteroidota bacterium]